MCLTCLSFRALRVRLALVSWHGTASTSVVGVASEALKALALTAVVNSFTHRVDAAGEAGADVNALGDPELVEAAGGGSRAVAVAGAVRNSRF